MDFDNFSAITDNAAGITYDEDDVSPDISELSLDEIRYIAETLQRDRTLRREDRKRKKQLEDSYKDQIDEIDSKNIDDGKNFCIGCSEKFRFLINSRRECEICGKGVCNSCISMINGSTLTCRRCLLEDNRKAKSGEWFVDISKHHSRFRPSANSVFNRSLRNYKSMSSVPPASQLISLSADQNVSAYNSFEKKHQPIYQTKADSQKSRKVNSLQPPVNVKIESQNSSVTKKRTNTAPDIQMDDNTISVTPAIIEKSVDVVDTSAPVDENSSKSMSLPSGHSSNLQKSKQFSASSASIYSEVMDSYKTGIVISGDILFSVYYNDKNEKLVVYIDQCRNLAIADRNKRETNPYIKTYLLPDKTKRSKKKTTSKKSNVDPVFKENIYYPIQKEILKSRILSVAVWHKNFLTYNYFLGEVHVYLADADLTSREPVWHSLEEKIKYSNRSGHIFIGELIIKLKYKPSTRKDGKGALHVYVVEAKQLQTEGKTLQVYLKGYLLPDRSNKGKQKTQFQKGNENFEWNRLLQFADVTLEELKDRSLEMSLYHYKRLNPNEFLGGVRLNLGLGHVSWMDAQGKEKEAWEEFLSNPNEYTEAILNLRPNLEY